MKGIATVYHYSIWWMKQIKGKITYNEDVFVSHINKAKIAWSQKQTRIHALVQGGGKVNCIR